jgi:hypothetical protein
MTDGGEVGVRLTRRRGRRHRGRGARARDDRSHDPVQLRPDTDRAEPEHQDYLQRIPNGYTCHFPRAGWVLPKRAEV